MPFAAAVNLFSPYLPPNKVHYVGKPIALASEDYARLIENSTYNAKEKSWLKRSAEPSSDEPTPEERTIIYWAKRRTRPAKVPASPLRPSSVHRVAAAPSRMRAGGVRARADSSAAHEQDGTGGVVEHKPRRVTN
jgi:hypothetical protein